MSALAPRVVITGGHGTLGQAMQHAFAAAGWDALAPGREELDVTNEAQISAYFSRLNRLDTLICNAGSARNVLLSKATAEDFSSVVDAHLRGSFLCSRAAIPLLRKASDGGSLLFISSRSARTGPRGQTNYAAAKAGMIALCQTISREEGAHNIRANVVMPGFMHTRMTTDLRPDIVEGHLAETTLGRFNTPENAARTILFLASLDHVSGQVFTLDSRLDPWC